MMTRCVSSPCANGAMCHDLLTGYVCECAENYHGKNCDKRVSDEQGCPDITTTPVTISTTATAATDVTLVTNGSTCAPCPEVSTEARETTTSCPTPEPPPDYCTGDPCENGGTCINTTGTYHCDCSNNWAGRNCTEGILQQESPSAGNRKKRTARGMTCQSVICPGVPHPDLAGGKPILTWPGGTPVLAGGYPSWPGGGTPSCPDGDTQSWPGLWGTPSWPDQGVPYADLARVYHILTWLGVPQSLWRVPHPDLAEEGYPICLGLGYPS